MGPKTAYMTSPARKNILIPGLDFVGSLPKRIRKSESRNEIGMARSTASPTVMREDWTSCGTRNTVRKTRIIKVMEIREFLVVAFITQYKLG